MDDYGETQPDHPPAGAIDVPEALPAEIGRYRIGPSRPVARVEPQAAVAGFGRFALESHDITATMRRALELTAAVAGVPMAWLVREAGPCRLTVLDSLGIPDLQAGDEVAIAEDFLAAYHTTQLLIVTDWWVETRFGQTPVLQDAGVRATLSAGVLVAGATCRLTAHDTDPHRFGETEVDVVQSIAHILAAAVERDQRERAQTVVAGFGQFALQSRDIASTVERALDVACEVVGAPWGLLARMVGPGQAQVLHTRGGLAVTTGEQVEIPDYLDAAYRSRRPFTSADWSLEDRTPPDGVDAAGVRASLSVGVLVEGEPCRLTVMDSRPRQFSDSEQDLLQAVAHVLGAAMERSRGERAQAAVAGFGRFALQSRDLAATVARAVEVATEVLDAPMGAVSRPAAGPGRLVMVHPHGPIGLAPGAEYVVPAELIAATQNSTTGVLVIDDWQTETRFAQAAASRAAGVRSSLTVTVPVGAEIWRLGVLDTSPRQFRGAEVDFVQSIAHLLSTASEREQSEARLRNTNRQLQQALLPPDLPDLPGIRAAARYVPAGGDQIGGDWYDVLALSHGGIGLVMGDVEGHDQTAAALMGQIRNVLRAYAGDGHTPAEILTELNRFVIGLTQRLVTCCYAELHAEQRTITCVSAGHPVPLVLQSHHGLHPLPVAPGLPLGVDADQHYVEHTDLLPQADALLMVTDGLVDDFPGVMHHGLDALAAAAAALAEAPIETLADRLVRQPPGAPQLRDDAALLAVRLTTATLPSCDTVRRTFANRPASPPAARAFVDDVLTAWNLHPLREPVTLAVSKLVTDAVIHTAGPIEVTLRRADPARIRLGVHDASDQIPRQTLPYPRELQALDPGARDLIDVDRLADSWGVDLTPDTGGRTVWLELSI